MTVDPIDPQSAAFRQATDIDRWDGDLPALVAQHGATVHEPIEGVAQIRLPEDYESDGWDVGRETPKTVEQAREALAVRIADPSAPDTAREITAYGSGNP